ncbi:unnamed protein product [Owenia fusiformis]|uniref:Uncharacterized protein n=1 Tax=Owenia fusiformis TaxID=6347 RepID=A0A8J1XZI4_OWEFU|nr:unnamed protein product [Owenia fusiformis]
MASGGPPIGRAGRAAQLLKAVQQPVRRPGEHEEQASPAPVPQAQGAKVESPAPVVPVGRGLMMKKMLEEKKKKEAEMAQQGVEAPRPVGRGALAMQSLASALPVTPGTPPRVKQASPPQRISPQKPSPQQQQTPRQATPGQPPAEQERKSRLMFALEREERPGVQMKGTSGKQIHLATNYIRVESLTPEMYQYHVSFEPNVDSRNIRFKLLNQHRDIMPYKVFDGAMLFLPYNLGKEKLLTAERHTDGAKITIKCTLTKVVPHEQNTFIFNNLFNRVLEKLKMVQIGRHYYDPHRPADVPQHRLQVWPGYITAIERHEGGLLLQADVSHRVLRTETVLDVLDTLVKRSPQTFQDEAVKLLVGTTVLTRYNNKNYRVDDINFSMSPEDTFANSKGEETSFLEYYQRAYGKEIRDRHQPLLINRPKKREQGAHHLEQICLIPELCYCTGLTDSMRQDNRVMKDLASHTRITPEKRIIELRKFIDAVTSNPEVVAMLEGWGLRLHSDIMDTSGRTLPPEDILTGGRLIKGTVQADWGRDIVRNNVIQAVDLRCWIVIVTNRDRQRGQDFVENCGRSCGAMGIRMAQPNVIIIENDRTESYLKAIRNSINEQVQMVVTIFPTLREDRYSAVKKCCNIECPVASQVIISKTIGDPKKLRSVCQKILLQMNAKLGGELWAVAIPPKSLMVIGIDVYHDGKGSNKRSVVGVVCSINQRLTKYYSRVAHQMPGEELVAKLKPLVIAALRKYHEVNHSLPERIVLFRDGVGDGQLDIVGGYEVSQLAECFPVFGEEYQPKLTVVIVQKRINTRMFAIQGRNFENAPPGTVLDHSVTRRDRYDFFIVSQHVRQGTVTPTHYIVVHDDSSFKTDQLQRLTYKMTHLYYNWPGTVRVPAPCQYAHKLAYLVGQSLHKEPNIALCSRLFYL